MELPLKMQMRTIRMALAAVPEDAPAELVGVALASLFFGCYLHRRTPVSDEFWLVLPGDWIVDFRPRWSDQAVLVKPGSGVHQLYSRESCCIIPDIWRKVNGEKLDRVNALIAQMMAATGAKEPLAEECHPAPV
jgi:hypothetical protein